jgi:hypothetical protein
MHRAWIKVVDHIYQPWKTKENIKAISNVLYNE